MKELVERSGGAQAGDARAPAGSGADPGFQLFRWCALEVMARCPQALACSPCPVEPWCGGAAKRFSGFLSVGDVLGIRARASRRRFESEMFCHHVARTDSVYPDFSPSLHVRPIEAQAHLDWVGGMDFVVRDPTVVLMARTTRPMRYDTSSSTSRPGTSPSASCTEKGILWTMFEPWVYVVIAALGLLAGVLGGMLGVGGSTIMIPGLVYLFGQDQREGFNQHLYQAAAMIVTVFVSAPAAWRHWKAGAIVTAALKLILPAALVATALGVWISNLPVFSDGLGGAPGPVVLGRVMAVFLVYVILENTRKMFRRPRPVDAPVDLTYVTPGRSSAVGLGMGLVAGVTGLGGGAVAVPLQQILLKLRLRNCIANSSAMICLTGIVGAIYKNATLSQHSLSIAPSLLLAALLAPTAMVGGYAGAKLTHTLPVRLVRALFIALMIAAAWKMAAI